MSKFQAIQDLRALERSIGAVKNRIKLLQIKQKKKEAKL